MYTKFLFILLILIILGIGVYFIIPPKTQEVTNINMEPDEKQNLIMRNPAVAGQFYPADKDELEEMIKGFLDNVPSGWLQSPDWSHDVALKQDGSPTLPREANVDTPQIIIVPHAGYVFSGQNAAYAFKQIQNKNYDKVILLGNSHNEYFDGLALDDNDAWQTPLGNVAIDKNAIAKLAEYDKIKIDKNIHIPEHSLEVELPFLQHILNNEFKLIPGLFGSDDNLDNLKEIAHALAEIIDDKTLVVISTDLSHYPNYEDAKTADQQTIDAILAKDSKKFLTSMQELESSVADLSTCACGWPAVVAAMELATTLNLESQLLNYTNSGDTPSYGDKDRVVGYAAIAFYSTQQINNKNMLYKDEQQVALKLARQTLENSFDKNVSISDEYKEYSVFEENRGVFVTLHKDGELRGCIGLIEPPEIPLNQAIQEMSLSAAFNDHRFSPLTQDELDKVEIEISVLTVPEKISNINEIKLGEHGVIVKKGANQGVFLPQVATETNWSKQEFLSELCSQKAGLAPNCYDDPDVELYTYEAQVFAE